MNESHKVTAGFVILVTPSQKFFFFLIFVLEQRASFAKLICHENRAMCLLESINGRTASTLLLEPKNPKENAPQQHHNGAGEARNALKMGTSPKGCGKTWKKVLPAFSSLI